MSGLTALVIWLVGGTALGLIEIAIVGARPEIDFSSYSLAAFMLYYWVPAAVGGILVWAGLAIASRLAGLRPNSVTWGTGIFAGAATFVYAGLAVNGMITGSPFTVVGIAANVAVLLVSAAVGFGVGRLARAIGYALFARDKLKIALAAAVAIPLIHLAWTWGNIDPGAGGMTGDDDESRPNVILLTIDALRADHLSLNGYERDTAPTLTRLAQEGANFPQACSQATITVRSMASLFTSLYPQMHGVMSSGLRISESVRTLPEVLSANGYSTVGFGGGNPSLFHDAGIVRGFDFYDDCRSIWALVPQKILSRLGLVARMDVGSARTTPPAETVFDKALSWLGHDPGSPFFMLVHLMDVHAPYLPPGGYADKFGNELEAGPSDLRLNKKCNNLVLGKSEMFFDLVESGEFDRMSEMDITHEEVSEAELGRLIDLYDGSIAYVDSQLERFLDELADKGLLDNALIIVTADHGEAFLDHGRLFHSGDLVYDELMRVPLVMRYPSAIPAGTEVDVPVRLIDVMPTVLEAVGLGASPEMDGGIHMEGTSLLPLLRGDEVEMEMRRRSEVYCEGALVSCVRTARWKYIDSQGHNTLALYDLVNDPQEKHNLLSEREEIARDMAGRLQSYTDLVRFYLEEHEGPTPIAVDEETRKRLRALGYVE
jgi:arylsulfatase A-like enzyme